MLEILRNVNIMKALDGHRHGNGDIFKQMSEQIKETGYIRLSEQAGKILKSSCYVAT